MTEIRVELYCKNCSKAMSMFVREAAERKGKIACPACGHLHEYSLADISELAALDSLSRTSNR